MVSVSYPGVYIEEVPSGVHTVTGVSTSIAAFFGRTEKGSLNKAKRILNLSDFSRTFGGSHPYSDLAQSVRQFFENGGADCYVVRLAHGAEKANITLQNADGVNVLTVTAKEAGNWGNAVSLEMDYNTPNPDETFNLRVIHREAGGREIASETHINLSMNPNSLRFVPDFVSQNSDLVDIKLADEFDILDDGEPGFSESRRPFADSSLVSDLNSLIHPPGTSELKSRFEISVNNGPFIRIDLRADSSAFTDGDAGNVASQIASRINAQLVGSGLSIHCSWQSLDSDVSVLRIISGAAVGDIDSNSSVRIRNSSTGDLASALMLGLDFGGIEVPRYSNFRPMPTATLFNGDINELAGLEQRALESVALSGLPISFSPDGTNKLITTDDDGSDPWYQDGLSSDVNGHNDGVREKLRIIAKTINETAPSTPHTSLPFCAEVWGYHLALIPTSGTINSTITIEEPSGTISEDFFTENVRGYALGFVGSSGFQDDTLSIGRDDDGNPLDPSDYFGSELEQTGFHALDSVDLFNLMVLPADQDISEAGYVQLLGRASQYCQAKRAFLLMDAPPSWTNADRRPVATSIEVNQLRSMVVKDHSAVFYPKVQYSDNGIKKSMGPSGMISGLMARIDSTRGVWKAPAGIEADLRGVLGVEVNLTDKENGVLNKLGVNCLRQFPNGFVNWGARTMDGSDDIGSEWKYIPIRRLALFIEESLYRGTKWVVFEPNDEPLWAKIRLNVGVFMTGLFRQGAFQGSSPNKAFFVKCDAETTTQADRNLGIVNIVVGFAPLKPAEFVIVKIQQIAGDLI